VRRSFQASPHRAPIFPPIALRTQTTDALFGNIPSHLSLNVDPSSLPSGIIAFGFLHPSPFPHLTSPTTFYFYPFSAFHPRMSGYLTSVFPHLLSFPGTFERPIRGATPTPLVWVYSKCPLREFYFWFHDPPLFAGIYSEHSQSFYRALFFF